MELNISALDMLPADDEAGLQNCNPSCMVTCDRTGGGENTVTVTTTGGWW
ncbi:hypothetical protein IL992_23460 [Microbispora sp. NEAU-D428]|nr:hypothetical protein [Microbispora sitophila]MBE3012132.1 hypothetical protein [Microbispora sitophila]